MIRTPAVAKLLFLGLTCCLPVVMSGGCGAPAPPPLSPTPEQDPARYERARLAEEKAKRQNQEAEKILMKRRRSALPVK